MQLLCVAIPALERMSKEGEEGRKKITKITRYVTVALAALQAYGLFVTLHNQGCYHDDSGCSEGACRIHDYSCFHGRYGVSYVAG